MERRGRGIGLLTGLHLVTRTERLGVGDRPAQLGHEGVVLVLLGLNRLTAVAATVLTVDVVGAGLVGRRLLLDRLVVCLGHDLGAARSVSGAQLGIARLVVGSDVLAGFISRGRHAVVVGARQRLGGGRLRRLDRRLWWNLH